MPSTVPTVPADKLKNVSLLVVPSTPLRYKKFFVPAFAYTDTVTIPPIPVVCLTKCCAVEAVSCSFQAVNLPK